MNGNGSENQEQFVANFDFTSSEVMSETSAMNGTSNSHIIAELKDLNATEGCTERSELLENQRGQTYRPLTLLRVIRGALCLVVLVSTAFMTLIFLAPVTFLILRLFSIHYSREATSFLFGHWLAMWPFLFEKINKTKVVFAGDSVPPRERILLFSNHRTEVDWMYIWDLALRKDRLGYIKYILKSSVRNAPIFGWGFHILEFILIDRKWEVDEPVIESMLSTFKDPQDPLWLVIFPEGTDFTDGKRYNFSDGIGIISESLAKQVAAKCRCDTRIPSAFQIRYGGYKGVVAVDPTSQHKLCLRPSMQKYISSDTNLDVLSWTRFRPCFLNRQIITLLSTLGVADRSFEMLQGQAVRHLGQLLSNREVALEALQIMSGGDNHKALVDMLSCGYFSSTEPYLGMMLLAFQASKLMEVRNRARIFVPKGRCLMGCLDETRTLKYGEVFVQISRTPGGNTRFHDPGLDAFGKIGVDHTTSILLGKVIVAKNPCLHPGDVRILLAVNIPRLHHMVDCVVFPQQGPR